MSWAEKDLIKKATICYHNQRRRCYTKTNPRYKDNGAKGIRVIYTREEFVSWFVENYRKFKGKNPSVGRVDHSKGYSLDNIRFESLADNSMERIIRCGPTKERKRIFIIDYKNNEKLMLCESINQAAHFSGVRKEHIRKYCLGKLKQSKGFTFKYADDCNQNNEFKTKIKNRLVKIIYPDGKSLVVETLKKAGELTGLHGSHIPKYISGKLKNKKGISFEIVG